jgi:5-methylcytosine-specific restriction protein A
MCGRPVVRAGKCAKHYSQADRRRGSAHERGYGTEHQDRFRVGVLRAADWACVACGGDATVADHYPRTRKQLLADGDDPNDPQFGRALCKRCHDRHTASTSIARRG